MRPRRTPAPGRRGAGSAARAEPPRAAGHTRPRPALQRAAEPLGTPPRSEGDGRPGATVVGRRDFLRAAGAAGLSGGIDRLVPAWARSAVAGDLASPTPRVLDGSAGPLDLSISRTRVRIGGREARATTIDGTLPGPILRFREGDEAVLHVHNQLDEETSVHWHGILLPNGMDGVPGVTFPGIGPGETFEYRYPIRQYGTYWYHSHSGFQEQLGQYGAFVIDPAEPEPFAYERDYVVVLSDWTFEDPDRIFSRLKKRSNYYNRRRRTLGDFVRDASERGLGDALGDRLMWGGMRMDPTDIADVTGTTYRYLLNGMAPEVGWTGLFRPGERVRLRFINAAAASYFDVRIPGLPMTVVQASGQHVEPVETDEIRVAIAETYDVIVKTTEERAYTIFAEAMDRSGFARGTLAPREGMEAPVPPRRARPVLTMVDMGMEHEEGGHGGHGAAPAEAPPPAGGAHAGHGAPAAADTHAAHGQVSAADAVSGGDAHAGRAAPPLRAPGTLPEPSAHGPDGHGPGNAAVPGRLVSRLSEPGTGLGGDGRRVLLYTDLRALDATGPIRPPEREIELHLTGNMERFMWSIDGVAFRDAEPIRIRLGERVRLVLVNDTMMNHPMHLHGMWMELENGQEESIPRVHTVNVKPAEKVSLLVTADAPGPWAFHCHVLYHMDAGMFRVVEIVDAAADAGEAGGGG